MMHGGLCGPSRYLHVLANNLTELVHLLGNDRRCDLIPSILEVVHLSIQYVRHVLQQQALVN